MMGKQEKRVLTLDRYEHGVVVNALNEMRNDLLEEERPTDIVDEVLLKVIDAPAKKVRIFGAPEKSEDFLGRGGATEQMSFFRSTAKRIVRSLRRRSDRYHLSRWKEKVNYPTEDRLQQKEKDTEVSF